MQQKQHNQPRLLTGRVGLALVGLAVFGVVGLTPAWANAAGDTNHTFTSPLPTGQQRPGPSDEIRELVDQIVDRDAILAEILGISTEEVATARENGVKIDELIAQAGLEKEAVRTAVKEAVATAVEQAVTDGVITQEQADQITNPTARPERGGEGQRGQGGHRPSGGNGGSGEPGGTIPEPGGTIPADNSGSESATTTNDNTADTTSPQRSEERERGPGGQANNDQNGGGRRPRR